MCRQRSLYLLLDFQSFMFIFSGVGSSRLFTCVQLYTLLASCIFLLSTIFSREHLCFVQLCVCVYLISRTLNSNKRSVHTIHMFWSFHAMCETIVSIILTTLRRWTTSKWSTTPGKVSNPQVGATVRVYRTLVSRWPKQWAAALLELQTAFYHPPQISKTAANPTPWAVKVLEHLC